MQYAYINRRKPEKSLFRNTEIKMQSCGGNTLYIVNSTAKEEKLAKKLKAAGAGCYLGDCELPGIEKYRPEKFYKYFAPQVVGFMMKNSPASRLVLCSENDEDIIYTVSSLSHLNLKFAAAGNHTFAAEKLKETTGIPLIFSSDTKESIVIRFSGPMPPASENSICVDFENSRFIFAGFEGNIDYACMTAEYRNIPKETLGRELRIIKIL